ncbi:MAG: prophage PRU01 transcriptional regulator [bacterium F083]|nr:MAG: prophage PRU01 transcriptional regulator [bacterium F083]
MYHRQLSEQAIISGFRKGDADIIREYFYGYCQAGYNIFDQRYQLREKENLDFMSLAHQYAIYLMEHNWKPLEDHSPSVSLKTWLINGFRYVVLDALKWYKKEYGSITFEDYLRSFDVTSDLRLQFNRMVEDVCDHAPLNREERLLIDMLLLRGFKGKEIAAELGMTPSAISQKYKKLKEEIIVPYFKKNFDMDLDMPEVMDERAILSREATMGEASMPSPTMAEPMAFEDMDFIREEVMEQKRTTPEFITELQPNEIFVFGSNLKGMHGGGAAYIAYRKFGAIMGQGVGLQGQSYAIPTMQGGVETIRPYVDEFIEFAKAHQELTFLVTRIGCGIAGFTDDEISPLFEKAHDVENIVLPPGW